MQGSKRFAIALVFAAGISILMPMVSASAAPKAPSTTSSYAYASDTVTFDNVDKASGTFSVSLLNLTNATVPVTFSPATTGCVAVGDPRTLAPRSEHAVKVTVTGCMISTKNPFIVAVKVADEQLPTLSVGPTAATPTPDWRLLWWFVVAFFAAVLLVGRAAWLAKTGTSFPDWLLTHRLHLAAKWSLKDSWLSNITVVTAAFSGIFGASDVLKQLLGTDASPVFALSTVAGAVAVGIAGVAPLVLTVLSYKGDVTPFGLIVGVGLTVGAVGGELAVITRAVGQLDLGGAQSPISWIGLIGGELLLFVYTWQTARQNLQSPTVHHRTPPKKSAAAGDAANAKLQEFGEALPDGVTAQDVLPDAYPELRVVHDLPRRSAVL